MKLTVNMENMVILVFHLLPRLVFWSSLVVEWVWAGKIITFCAQWTKSMLKMRAICAGFVWAPSIFSISAVNLRMCHVTFQYIWMKKWEKKWEKVARKRHRVLTSQFVSFFLIYFSPFEKCLSIFHLHEPIWSCSNFI